MNNGAVVITGVVDMRILQQILEKWQDPFVQGRATSLPILISPDQFLYSSFKPVKIQVNQATSVGQQALHFIYFHGILLPGHLDTIFTSFTQASIELKSWKDGFSDSIQFVGISPHAIEWR
jgi:hypothetical protein